MQRRMISHQPACDSRNRANGKPGPPMLTERPSVSDLSPTQPRPKIAELLSPAGDLNCLKAAVENGADAVYFGLDCGFNARARAGNFAPEQLPDAMRVLHERGMKGYLTLNTLAFSSELAELEELVRQITHSGVDAVLVQDLGLARLIRSISPELGLHASTQMTLATAESIAVASDLGIERVVLPRELSLTEISRIHAATSMELEAFVHGALCVAWSGQCLTSESLGGRSANRGQCAQACRLPYEIVCDGDDVATGDQQYLLSPQDLAAYPLIAEMLQAGIRSFKIEGRLKTPEYVANITRHYRSALDAAMAGHSLEFPRRRVQEMEQSFSRGFSTGWLRGHDHKALVPATSSSKRGVLLGEVVRLLPTAVVVRLEYTVRAGDGVVFDGDRYRNAEQGGRVYHVRQNGEMLKDAVDHGLVELSFDTRSVQLDQLYPGQKIWKTDDPRLNEELRRTFEGPDPRRKVSLDLQVTAAAGDVLQISGTADNGCSCSLRSTQNLEAARKHPLTERVLREQLGRLGGSLFELRRLDATITGTPMVPLSVLGQLRRDMLHQLQNSLPSPPRVLTAGHQLRELRTSLWNQESSADQNTDDSSPVALTVLCRTLEQLRAAAACQADRLIADFQDLREYHQAVTIAANSGIPLALATTRIIKPGEQGLLSIIRKADPAQVLIRNLSSLRFFQLAGVATVGDYALNVTNELTAEFLIQQGLQWLTPSYDLNREQLLQLIDCVPSSWMEVVLHQHMPMFHMEHCVFCAMLSPGTDHTNCGRPCDTRQVELRDRTGLEHPLVADIGCRNTLFNAMPQSSAEIVPELLQAGVGRFRIEMLREKAEDVPRLLAAYRELLSGQRDGRSVWKELNAMNRVGITRGTLEEKRNPLAIL